MSLNVLYDLAVLLFAGLISAKLIKKLRLPDVTGYLLGGLLIGPYLLGILSAEAAEGLAIISDMALGFIAFTVGGEFKFSYFKRVGATPIVIAFFESIIAVLFVTLGLLVAGCELPFAIVLGAIAAATAPAATVMVIKQYKARGPVTETLLSVVAIDDAVALVAFGFAVAIAGTLNSTESVSLLASIAAPVVEVLLAVGLGIGIGFVFTFALRFFPHRDARLALVIAFVFLGSALATALNVSALLLCMALGATFTNLSRTSAEVYSLCDQLTPPLFMMFFVLSGADLNITVLPSIGLIGIVYVLLRVAGKWSGAALGAKLMKAPATVCRYLGPALIPQAGVAIGLTFVAQTVVPQYAETIRAVILCGTLIYELVGPAITKKTLQEAGEIDAGI
ncbi:cation:proton antiporter [Pygmaiobacter massiliensis]|uniref:cation:proton antiporter n=1 Tax=Pygmaiobacter massiliensis TaxID=1917873 RepID=UPI002A82B366|nr:cation:proton antiporter [Pygmaiobacter massiliensis]MDY4785068.1 cation:proton antiporter [Pygmaiobacter massiliensis]